MRHYTPEKHAKKTGRETLAVGEMQQVEAEKVAVEEGLPKPKIVMRGKPRPAVPVLPPNSIHDLVTQAFDAGVEEQRELADKIARGRSTVKHYVGLSKTQRKFLLHRALVNTDTEACKYAGTNLATFRKWQRDEPTFMEAYASLWVNPSDFTLKMLDGLLPKTAEVLEDALTNKKERLKAVEILLRARGILKPAGEEGLSTYEEALARQLAERGYTLPPAMKGALEGTVHNPYPPLSLPSPPIDADYSVIEEVEGEGVI